MGGVNLDTGGGGGKKSVDMVIPLVPFIDMLAMMITFLMMTAVWTQIGKLQVASQGQNDATTPPTTPTLQLNLTLTERGYMLNAGATAIEIPKKGEDYDAEKLLSELKKIKKDNPDHRTITVAAEDAIEYQWVVQVVDTCLSADLPDVTVTAALG